jgi:replicative DNA helicase
MENNQIQFTETFEKSLLSSILLSPEILESIDDISHHDFLNQDCSKVFYIIKQLESSGEPVDLISVTTNDASVSVFCAELMSFVGSSSNYRYYADNVKRLSTLRKLNLVSVEVQAKTLDTNQNPDEIIDSLVKSISDINVLVGSEEISSKQASDEVMSGIDKLRLNPLDVVGISSGFGSIDLHLSGFHKSDLMILAARPARGKSSFALQLAKNVAMYSNTSVLMFSLEMATDQLMQRLLASESKVELGNIRTGKINDNEYEALKISSDILSNIPLYFHDKPSITLKDIKRAIKNHNAKHKQPVGFVIVDYLQLMAAGNGKDSMVQIVGEISRGLKLLAMEFNIPILALSQLSRNVEHRGGKPRLSDLRDSGSIEQDADIVMFLHSSDTQTNELGMRDIDLLVEKNRNGATFEVPLSFDGAKMVFQEVDKDLNW